VPYPTSEEFRSLLLSDPPNLGRVVRDYVFQGVPYVFRERPENMQTLRRHLRDKLNIAEENIVVAGSAQIGFSLAPDTFAVPFSRTSDIDVVVVDERIFDRMWITMLRWHYPRRVVGLEGPDLPWVGERRKDLYWGWFVPDRIRYEGLSYPDDLRPLRDLKTQWFNAFQSLGREPALARRRVSGRLYRSWDHAQLYHVDGLRQIRAALRQGRRY
jgi:hypothetical protein